MEDTAQLNNTKQGVVTPLQVNVNKVMIFVKRGYQRRVLHQIPGIKFITMQYCGDIPKGFQGWDNDLFEIHYENVNNIPFKL